MNLRKTLNNDLEKSMEDISEWGLPVELESPDGVKYDLKKDTEDKLTGQVLYNRTEFNPATGEEISIDEPMVTLRMNSLTRIPAPGENWIIRIPETPDPDAVLVSYALTPTRAIKFNRSIGIMIIYLQKVIQI